jgi:hypothetical protein
VVSVTDPYGRILGFIDRNRYFSVEYLLSCRIHTAILNVLLILIFVEFVVHSVIHSNRR